MRPFALLAAALLALGGCSDGPAWPAPSPALWHVSDSQGHEGWMLGTVHALPDGVEWLTPTVSRSVEKADILVVEIANLAESDAANTAFARVSRQPGLPPLLSRFGGEERARMERLLEQAEIAESDLAGLKSWAAAMVLSSAIRRGNPVFGVDRQLLATEMPVTALETYASQFAIFDALPPEEQEDLLLQVACEAEEAHPDTGLRAWVAGDLATLEQLGARCMLGDPQLRAALLDDRNQVWVEPVANSISEGRRPFVAVGAAHMLGPQGLPALLAQRGYTVTRIQ